MGFGSIFKKIGKGITKGAISSGKVLATIDDIPGARTAIAMIPVAGPILAVAAEKCNMAEAVFTDPGSHEKKRQWAISQLRNELKKLGVDDKYIDDLVSVGFLIKEGVVSVVGVEDEENDLNEKSDNKPIEKTDEKSGKKKQKSEMKKGDDRDGSDS